MSTLTTLQSFKTQRQVIDFAEKTANILTMSPDGVFTAYFDDVPNDRRIVVYVTGLSYRIHTLSGYDAEKHRWTVEGYSFTHTFDRRSSYPSKTYQRLADTLQRFRPRLLSLYRSPAGEWRT